jgi:diguanylate cyclase (GGDEF)-like protein
MRILNPSLAVRRPGLAVLAIGGLALATTWLGAEPTNWRLILVALSITGAVSAAAFGVAWERRQGALLLLPICCEGVIALFRHAHGGTASGYGTLTILPVVWAALVLRRRDVVILVACSAVTLGLPMLLIGGPDYPASEFRRVVLLTAVAGVVGIVIESLIADRHRLSTYAQTDALTGLPNRHNWDDQLLRALAQADRSGEPLSVAVCDVNGLKRVNDRGGHAAGDELLRSIAQRLRESARSGDLVARIGGDEFALLLPGATGAAAYDMVERVIDALPSDRSFAVGIAEWDGHEDATALVARADRRMYERKTIRAEPFSIERAPLPRLSP